ncbi:MAG: hypothetical protein HYS81_01420 [Candidatus Aenigmatarchaeota archaeon]|nr:MAG: hypothetical protein HYS81_01420 [Candidatus Aenigmarchaeota archaeon]
MGTIKHRGLKKRLLSRARVTSAPLWANLRKFGIKRTRTRRIRVVGQKHWRRDSKVKA